MRVKLHRRIAAVVCVSAVLALAGCHGFFSTKQGQVTEHSVSLSIYEHVMEAVPKDEEGHSQEAREESRPDKTESFYTFEECRTLKSGARLEAERIGEGLTEQLFYGQPVSDAMFTTMQSGSWHGTIAREELSYLRMLYTGFDGETYIGEMIVNRKLAADVLGIFRELYEKRYPIEKMNLMDHYGGDDDQAMADNNTSCFNDRKVPGTSSISKHALGCAIDINPFYNPFIHRINGVWRCDPPGSEAYQDRSKEFPYKIDKEDLCYQVFQRYGFSWGGEWNSMKDYQHFYKEVR